MKNVIIGLGLPLSFISGIIMGGYILFIPISIEHVYQIIMLFMFLIFNILLFKLNKNKNKNDESKIYYNFYLDKLKKISKKYESVNDVATLNKVISSLTKNDELYNDRKNNFNFKTIKNKTYYYDLLELSNIYVAIPVNVVWKKYNDILSLLTDVNVEKTLTKSHKKLFKMELYKSLLSEYFETFDYILKKDHKANCMIYMKRNIITNSLPSVFDHKLKKIDDYINIELYNKIKKEFTKEPIINID